MTKIRFLIVSAGSVALLLGGGTAFANVGALSGNADSHGDAVASAARTTCPHGPGGVHGACVSAIASGTSESDANTEDGAGETNEDASTKSNHATNKSHGHAAKNADKARGTSDSN